MTDVLKGVTGSRMNVKQLQQNLIYLIEKYISDREDLKKLICEDADSAKYILAQIDKYKSCEYTDDDMELIKDIVFYYV